MLRFVVYLTILIILSFYAYAVHAGPIKRYDTQCSLFVNGIRVPWQASLRMDQCKQVMDYMTKRDQTHALIVCKCLTGINHG